MIWNSWNEFWAMGGYALYVWGSFAVTFGFIALEVGLAQLRQRRALQIVLQSLPDDAPLNLDGSP